MLVFGDLKNGGYIYADPGEFQIFLLVWSLKNSPASGVLT